MSARNDAARIAALVHLVDQLSKGENQTLADCAEKVFGWDPERVFLAVDAALRQGLIAKNDTDGQIQAVPS